MANFIPTSFFRFITGRLAGRSQVITRIKHFRHPDGKLFKDGPSEASLKQRRDYKYKPMTPAEQSQRNKWTAVCREASAIVHNPDHPRYAELQARWRAQTTSQPDAHIGKLVLQFPNFVRAVLLRES